MPKPTTPTEIRFWSYVNKTDNCWLWTGGTTEGYGALRLPARKMQGAHRYSYELHIGPIPAGTVIDHKCRVRTCVNPEHLQAVSHLQNSENLNPTPDSNRTGHLNVYKRTNAFGYVVIVRAGGKRHYGGSWRTIEEAANAAAQLRNRVKTNNLGDRATVGS